MKRRRLISFLCLVAAALALRAPDASAQSSAAIRAFDQLSADSFRVQVKVVCNGAILYGLAPAQFAFRENEQPLSPVTMVKPAVQTPDECYDAALVISRGASMALGVPRLIDQVKSAAKTFVDNMRSGCDQAAVISFGSDVGLDAFLTQDKEKLKSRIDSISTSGNLAMWDAAFLSLLELESNGTHAARASIIITNGEDNSSTSSRAQDVLAQARAAGVTVYIVSIANADTAGLKATAIRSGGRFYSLPNGANLSTVLTQISAAIREEHQLYTFEYRSPLQKVRRRLVEITASGCGAPLTARQYFDTGVGGNPPAPFQLGTQSIRNTDLFRLDRVGCTVPDDLVADTLRLRWQVSSYTDPYLNDTLTYTWNAILDSAGRQVLLSIPADNAGHQNTATLDGNTLYKAILSRGIRANADSLLVRVPWFVRASNAFGQTYVSDTAGVSKRAYTTALPATPALMLSFNRPPAPAAVTTPPRDSLAFTTPDGPAISVAWNAAKDISIDKGRLNGGFRNYNTGTRQWETDASRTVDTVSYQVRIEVVAALPAGKGAAPGTQYRLSTGGALSTQLPPSTLDQAFGGFASANRADSVWIRVTIDARDFNQTNGKENVTFDSVWSGTGCRPHLSSSAPRMLLLVYRKNPVNVVDPDQPSRFLLEQNYPNPFSHSTTIPFLLPPDEAGASGQRVDELAVFDLLGRKVLDLTPRIALGSDRVTLDGAELPRPGVYVYRLRAGQSALIRKMTFVR